MSNPVTTPPARALVAALAALLLGASSLRAQDGCRPLTRALGDVLERGWAAYRANRTIEADSAFQTVLRRCPAEPGALSGAGYVLLRGGEVARAREHFDRALRAMPRSYDALLGAGLASFRAGDHATSRRYFERVLAIAPADETARDYLRRIPAPIDSTRLTPPRRPAATSVAARAARRIFEEPDGRGAWRPLWLKFVNLGAALPGRHPSEFPPDDGTYERWIADLADLGANAVRVYTIHPPHFYRALRQWNVAHPATPIRLIHGVWTELPPGEEEERYDDPAWNAEFRAEMRRVVDLLHGRAAIQPRPGHAHGLYTEDVSPWVSAYIIGREWEPYSVVAHARRHPQATSHRGTYVTLDGGNAVDVWLAQSMDFMIGYEMDRYNAQRPMAYTNWPTLDPLPHPTESTLAQEDSIRRARGEEVPEQPREFDNDAIGLDATKMKPTAAFPAGLFASYHAYPYYPDFMVLDPRYRQARSPEGPSAYFGYLRELVEHHGDLPVVISEYGVPSSRGNAHLQPQGWHHGGHSEQAQGEIDARLTRDIVAAGAAGAGLFALIDEWFKKNWIVIDFEVPLERNRLWLNALDAEQNYGLIAMRPGRRDSAITIDGRAGDWRGRAPLLSAASAGAGDPLALRALAVSHDEGYLYLRLDVGRVDWSRARYLIGIDTYDRARGDTRLPYTGATSPVGLEFVIDLRGPEDSRLLVDEPYNLYRDAAIRGASPPAMQQIYNRPFQTVANSDGRYDTLVVQTNRRRVGRDGTVFPAMGYERNRLLHARQPDHSLADWYADPSGVIELRLPWGMLHVLDPSSRLVLFGDERTNEIDGRPTDGIRFVVQSYDPGRPSASGERLPRAGVAPATFTWAGWEEPRWWWERKPAFEAMKRVYRAIPADPRVTAGSGRPR